MTAPCHSTLTMPRSLYCADAVTQAIKDVNAAFPMDPCSRSKMVRFDASLNRTYVIPRKTESSWGSWQHNLGNCPAKQQISSEMTSHILDSFGENEPFDWHFSSFVNVDDGDFTNDENDENVLMELLDSIGTTLSSFDEEAKMGGDTAASTRTHKRRIPDSDTDGTTVQTKRQRIRASAAPVAQPLQGLEARRPLTEIACL